MKPAGPLVVALVAPCDVLPSDPTLFWCRWDRVPGRLRIPVGMPSMGNKGRRSLRRGPALDIVVMFTAPGRDTDPRPRENTVTVIRTGPSPMASSGMAQRP